MLSQNDRRRLEEIERQLRSEDPEWVSRFAPEPPHRGGSHRSWSVVVIVVGVVLALLALLALLPAVSFLVLVATVTSYAWLRRRGRRAAGEGPG
jgi:Flp pilus assembly protein TadB